MTRDASLAALERRYRRALRWYPSSWRAVNADVVVGTMLDAAEGEGRQRPKPGELLNLAGNGLRERARLSLPASIRDRAAAIALGLGASLAAIEFFGLDWSAPWGGRIPGLSGLLRHSFGPFASAAVVFELAWLIAFAVTLVGLRRVGRVVLALSVLSSALLVPFADRDWAWGRPPTLALAGFAVLAVIAGQGDPGRSARTVGWTAISAVVALASQLFMWRRQLPFPIEAASARTFWSDFNVPLAVLMLVALLVLFSILRQRDWVGALLLAVGPWLLVVFCIQVANDGQYSRDADLAWAVAGAAVLALLAVIRLFGLRARANALIARETKALPPVD